MWTQSCSPRHNAKCNARHNAKCNNRHNAKHNAKCKAKCKVHSCKVRSRRRPGLATGPTMLIPKGAGSFHIHRKTMKDLWALAVLGVREHPNLAQDLVTHSLVSFPDPLAFE